MAPLHGANTDAGGDPLEPKMSHRQVRPYGSDDRLSDEPRSATDGSPPLLSAV